MTWNPTNTDDVQLIVSRVERTEDGTNRPDILDTNSIVVDDFSIETEEDLEVLSGIGNAEALGISKGDINHSFSFTVQGEDASLFNDLTTDSSGRAHELEIIVKAEDYMDKMTGAYAGTRNLSGTSGDPIEYEAEGVAKSRDPGTIS